MNTTAVFRTLARDLELHFLIGPHADELYALTLKNRDHLREWLPWLGAEYSIDNTREFLKNCELQHLENRGFQCGIFFQGALAGVIGFHSIDWNNRKSSLGYWLSKDLGGRGIMTRSSQAFVDFAFEVLKLNRVEIRCATGNTKSQAIPKRMGFRHEGRVRESEWLYDHFVDHEVYGQLYSDWKLPSAIRGF